MQSVTPTAAPMGRRLAGRSGLTIVLGVDRDAIAREQRRRQAQEALEFERDRASSLEEQVEAIVAELEGPRIDEETLATMAPEDVEVVRAALLLDGDREGSEDEWPEIEGVSF